MCYFKLEFKNTKYGPRTNLLNRLLFNLELKKNRNQYYGSTKNSN